MHSTQEGFQRYDLIFDDCNTPPDGIADEFLRITEDHGEGAIAVHCKSGLGRTGTLIALYVMKHFGFTANEAISWLRKVLPGSVICPQQQYLKDNETRMWNLKRLNSLGLGLDTGYGRAYSKWPKNKHCRALSVAAKLAAVVHKGGDTCAVTSRVLSEMVGQGMLFRSRVTSAVLLHPPPIMSVAAATMLLLATRSMSSMLPSTGCTRMCSASWQRLCQ